MAEFGMMLFSIPKAEAHSKKRKKRNDPFIRISIQSNSKHSSLRSPNTVCARFTHSVR